MAELMNETDVFARKIRLLILLHKNTEGKRIASALGERMKFHYLFRALAHLVFSFANTKILKL